MWCLLYYCDEHSTLKDDLRNMVAGAWKSENVISTCTSKSHIHCNFSFSFALYLNSKAFVNTLFLDLEIIKSP